MKIGGFQEQTLVDYPGKVSSVVFTQGCNFRCPFCHNDALVIPEKIGPSMAESKVLNYLKENKSLLDALVITGGEPTLQADLKEFITKVKEMGLKIKLDTNGTKPGIVKDLIDNKLIDYIAMDIKAPLELKKYIALTGGYIHQEKLDKIKNTIKIIMDSGIDHEFRTTVIKELHSKEDIQNICASIPNAKKYSIQKFNPETVLKSELSFFKPYTDTEIKEILTNVAHKIHVIQSR